MLIVAVCIQIVHLCVCPNKFLCGIYNINDICYICQINIFGKNLGNLKKVINYFQYLSIYYIVKYSYGIIVQWINDIQCM